MKKKINKIYKNEYNGRDNSAYINKKAYEPTTEVIRVFNAQKEAYEYKEVIINHKLDWENTEKAINQKFESEENE